MAVDVGLDLAPQGAARPPAPEPDLVDRRPHFGEKGESVLEAEGDPFEDGAHDVAPGVGRREAHQRAARVGIEMGRALPHQVGGPEEAVRPGRDLGRLLGQPLVGVAPVVAAGAEPVAEPAQAETRGLRHPHDVPAPRHRVAEGVEPPARVERRTVGGGEHHTRGPDGGADDPRGDDAHAGGAGRLVPRPGDHGDARLEPRGQRPGRVHPAAHLLRFVELRQERGVDLRGFEHLARPGARGHVAEERPGSVRDVDRPLPRQAEADIVLREHDGADAAPVFRLPLPHPEEFGQGEIGERGIARQPDQPLGPDARGEGAALRLRPHVAPDQRRPHHGIGRVEQHRPVHLPRKADAGDGVPAQSRLIKRPAHRDPRGAPPVFGFLLRPPDFGRREGRVLRGSRPRNRPGFIQDQGPGPPGADIYPQKIHGPSSGNSNRLILNTDKVL